MERKLFYKQKSCQRLAAALLLWLGCCVLAFAQNTVSLTGGEGKPGGLVTVGVLLKNTDAVTAMQVDVPLDESLTFVEGSEVIEQERLDGHEVKVSKTESGFRVLLYSLSLKPLTSGKELLLSLKLKLKRMPGTYTLHPQVRLTGTDGSELSCDTADGEVIIRAARMEVLTSAIDFGKVPVAASYERNITVKNSGNETLEVSEIAFSDEWLTGTPAPITIKGGSTEQIKFVFSPLRKGTYNGSISLVSDGLNGNQTIPVKAELYTINELHLQPVSGISDEIVSVKVRMKNTEEISAVQFALELSEELEYIPGSEQCTAPQHKANGTFKDGCLTIMVYSLTDAAIAMGDDELLSFQIKLKGKTGTYELTPKDVRIGNMQLENVCSASYGTKVSIASPRIECSATVAMGDVDQTMGKTQSFRIQNTGSSTLVIENVTFLDERFATAGDFPIRIEPGKDGYIQLKMLPSDHEGEVNAIMNIYSNDPETRMATVSVTGHVYAPNTILLQGYPMGQDRQMRLDVCMQNESDITAFQMDVHCPVNVELSKEKLIPGERLAEHQLYCTSIGDGAYRVSCYSLSNKSIKDKSGVLFSFVSTSENSTFSIDNVKLSDALGVNKYTGQDVEMELPAYSYLHLELPEGWNWISCNLSNQTQVMDFIQPIVDKVEQLVGFDAELVRDAQLGLVGQLKEIAPETYYLMRSNAAIDYSWTGMVYATEQKPITLQKGWNWIGYIPVEKLVLEEALQHLSPSEGDVIKSYDNFSTFSDGKWNGTLTYMEPGQGYMYLSGKGTTFCYPSVSSAKSMNTKCVQSRDGENQTILVPWNIAKHKYPNNMGVIAEVPEYSSHSPFIVGAFVGDECRGLGQMVDDKIFITVYGDAQTKEKIMFKVYDVDSGNEFFMKEECEFDGGQKGTFLAPFVLTSTPQTGMAQYATGTPYIISLDARQETLNIEGELNGINQVIIMNFQGVVFAESNQWIASGMKVSHLPEGNYIVLAKTTKGVFTKKIQKTK